MDSNPEEELLTSLRRQADEFPNEMWEIEELASKGDYRQIFRVIWQLKKSGLWKPSPRDQALLEEFWWKYAN